MLQKTRKIQVQKKMQKNMHNILKYMQQKHIFIPKGVVPGREVLTLGQTGLLKEWQFFLLPPQKHVAFYCCHACYSWLATVSQEIIGSSYLEAMCPKFCLCLKSFTVSTSSPFKQSGFLSPWSWGEPLPPTEPPDVSQADRTMSWWVAWAEWVELRSAGRCGLEVYAGPVCLDLKHRNVMLSETWAMNSCLDEVMPLPEWNSEDVDLAEWKLLLKNWIQIPSQPEPESTCHVIGTQNRGPMRRRTNLSATCSCLSERNTLCPLLWGFWMVLDFLCRFSVASMPRSFMAVVMSLAPHESWGWIWHQKKERGIV